MIQAPPVTNITTGLGLSILPGKCKSSLIVIPQPYTYQSNQSLSFIAMMSIIMKWKKSSKLVDHIHTYRNMFKWFMTWKSINAWRDPINTKPWQHALIGLALWEKRTGTCCGGDLHKQCCSVQILRSSSSSSKLEVIQQELWSDIFIELPFVVQNKESHSYKQSRPNQNLDPRELHHSLQRRKAHRAITWDICGAIVIKAPQNSEIVGMHTCWEGD